MKPLLLIPAAILCTQPLLAQTPAAPADPFASIPSGVPAPPPPPSAEDIATIERLEKLQQEFERQKRDVVAAAVSKFNNAAQSEAAAVDFYFACLGLVRSRTPLVDSSPTETKRDAREEKEQAEAQRKAMIEDAYGTPGRGAALQLQLQYLVFTLEGGKISKPSDVIQRYREYAGKAATIAKTYSTPGAMPERKEPDDSKGNRKSSRNSTADRDARAIEQYNQRTRQQIMGTLTQGVLGSLFAEAYTLQTYFKPKEGWVDSPFELNTMYERAIFPHYRATKPTELNTIWDEYLGYSIINARSTQDDRAYARWGITDYKNLQWAKWMDIARHGNRSIAINELVGLVTGNPAHPNMEGWMTDLATLKDELIKPKIPVEPTAPPPAP
jgi:hypothetical protein